MLDKHPSGGGVDIALAAVRKTYTTPGGVTIEALAGANLLVPAGSVTALVGPSGSGKSTLLHLVGGMDRADAGAITVGDQDVMALSRSALVKYRRTVGFVFQSFALLPALTARDNVMLPTIPYRNQSDTKARAEKLLADVGLASREDALPSQLSGGQRQRVAIARALMNEPRLLVADEPTGNLDSTTGTAILDVLLSIRETRGTTILIATHDPSIAAACDRTHQIADGSLVVGQAA